MGLFKTPSMIETIKNIISKNKNKKDKETKTSENVIVLKDTELNKDKSFDKPTTTIVYKDTGDITKPISTTYTTPSNISISQKEEALGRYIGNSDNKKSIQEVNNLVSEYQKEQEIKIENDRVYSAGKEYVGNSIVAGTGLSANDLIRQANAKYPGVNSFSVRRELPFNIQQNANKNLENIRRVTTNQNPYNINVSLGKELDAEINKKRKETEEFGPLRHLFVYSSTEGFLKKVNDKKLLSLVPRFGLFGAIKEEDLPGPTIGEASIKIGEGVDYISEMAGSGWRDITYRGLEAEENLFNSIYKKTGIKKEQFSAFNLINLNKTKVSNSAYNIVKGATPVVTTSAISLISPTAGATIGYSLLGANTLASAETIEKYYGNVSLSELKPIATSGLISTGFLLAGATTSTIRYLNKPIVERVGITNPKNTLFSTETIGLETKINYGDNSISKVLFNNQKLYQISTGGYMTKVSTPYRNFLSKVTGMDLSVYSGNPYFDKAGYSKAFSMLKGRGYSENSVKEILRYSAPKTKELYLTKGNLFVYNEQKAAGEFFFEQRQPSFIIDEKLNIKSRGATTTKTGYYVERRLLNNEFVLEDRFGLKLTNPKNNLNIKGAEISRSLSKGTSIGEGVGYYPSGSDDVLSVFKQANYNKIGAISISKGVIPSTAKSKSFSITTLFKNEMNLGNQGFGFQGKTPTNNIDKTISLVQKQNQLSSSLNTQNLNLLGKTTGNINKLNVNQLKLNQITNQIQSSGAISSVGYQISSMNSEIKTNQAQITTPSLSYSLIPRVDTNLKNLNTFKGIHNSRNSSINKITPTPITPQINTQENIGEAVINPIIIPTPNTIPPIKNPTPRNNLILKPFFPRFDFSFVRGKNKKSSGVYPQQTRYSPSLGSILSNFTSRKIPKGKFTGLELRPMILTNKKFKKNKFI